MAGCDMWTDEQLLSLLEYFKTSQGGLRNAALLMLGVTTGWRVSELLILKRRDVLNVDKSTKKSIYITTSKSKHGKTAKLSPECRDYLTRWLRHQERKKGISSESTPVFTANGRRRCAMNRIQIWSILKRASKLLGFEGRFGTHSMRKTFGKKMYAVGLELERKGSNVDRWLFTGKALGHSSSSYGLANTQAYLSFEFVDPNDFIESAFVSFREKLRDKSNKTALVKN